MLLLVVLLDPKYLAVSILILEDVGILLSLEPGVLQIEHDRFSVGAAFQSSVHSLAVLEAAGVQKSRGGTPHFVLRRSPLRVREIFEIVINFQILRLSS